jgi:Flp pilus assembly pilin Flp
MIEYALIASILTGLLVAAYKRVGIGYTNIYNNVSNAL